MYRHNSRGLTVDLEEAGRLPKSASKSSGMLRPLGAAAGEPNMSCTSGWAATVAAFPESPSKSTSGSSAAAACASRLETGLACEPHPTF